MKLLRDRVGVGYYFYFFTLLEQCGEASSDELQEKYTFHDSTIRSLWGVNLKKSERVANEMASVCLLEFKKVENTFTFRIPNLSKYLGQYESKSTSNMPNKRKEKESKVNSNETLVIATDFKPEFFEPLEAVKTPDAKKVSRKKKVAEKVKTSPLAILFKPENEIQGWLLTGLCAAQKKLFDEYSHHVLAEEIEKAYIWQLENNKNYKAGLYLVNWMGRHKNSTYNPDNKKTLQDDLEEFFKTYGSQNEAG